MIHLIKLSRWYQNYKKEPVELETILTDKKYFEDNDGDDNEGFKATGTFRLEIKDNNNNIVKL